MHLHTFDTTIIASGNNLCQVSSDIGHRAMSPDHPILGCCRTDFLSFQIDSTSVGTAFIKHCIYPLKCLALTRCIYCLMGYLLSSNLSKLNFIFIAVFDSKNDIAWPCPLIKMEVRVRSLNTCCNVRGLTASINTIWLLIVLEMSNW